MTVDTSPAAIEALVRCLRTLGRDMDKDAAYDWDEHENVFLAANTIEALVAERDAMQAEAESLYQELEAAGAFIVGTGVGLRRMMAINNDQMQRFSDAFRKTQDAIGAWEERQRQAALQNSLS